MKLRKFVEDYFEIDDAKSGQLVPFKFNVVQRKFYDELAAQGIEEQGIKKPIREIILKARRQGFTSLILALFAADDIMSRSPTETMVLSYKIDGTKTFIKRYKNFVLSYYRKRWGVVDENKIFKTSASGELVHAENGARFYCGTASSRIGGRGGTLQKLLFSEAAFYPDLETMKAREIIDGTMRQVDIEAGHVFIESTANGDMNHYAKMWRDAESGQSRFKPRFFSWKETYTPEQFEIIKSEFTGDKRMLKQEYPETVQEAFLSSGDRFFDHLLVERLMTTEPVTQGDWQIFKEYKPGHRYALGCDVSEGIGRHSSTVVVIDFDATITVEGRLIQRPTIVATYANNKIAPDLFAHEIRSGGNRYGSCIAAVERNNHGFTTLATLKDSYFNIYKDTNDRLGWQTNMASKPKMLHELRTAIHEQLLEVSDKALKAELMSYPQFDLNVSRVDELDESGGHYDRVIACSIAWQMRSLAVPSMLQEHRDEGFERFSVNKNFDKFSVFNEI